MISSIDLVIFVVMLISFSGNVKAHPSIRGKAKLIHCLVVSQNINILICFLMVQRAIPSVIFLFFIPSSKHWHKLEIVMSKTLQKWVLKGREKGLTASPNQTSQKCRKLPSAESESVLTGVSDTSLSPSPAWRCWRTKLGLYSYKATTFSWGGDSSARSERVGKIAQGKSFTYISIFPYLVSLPPPSTRGLSMCTPHSPSAQSTQGF